MPRILLKTLYCFKLYLRIQIIFIPKAPVLNSRLRLIFEKDFTFCCFVVNTPKRLVLIYINMCIYIYTYVHTCTNTHTYI